MRRPNFVGFHFRYLSNLTKLSVGENDITYIPEEIGKELLRFEQRCMLLAKS